MNKVNSFYIAVVSILCGCSRIPEPTLLTAAEIDGPDTWKAYVLSVQDLVRDRGVKYYLADDVLYSGHVDKLDGQTIVLGENWDIGIDKCYGLSVHMPNPEGYYLTMLLVDKEIWIKERDTFKEFPDVVSWSDHEIDNLLVDIGSKWISFNGNGASHLLVDLRFGKALDRELVRSILSRSRDLLKRKS